MDCNEMKKVPYVPSLEAIKESEEICNGYIGKYNGKGLYEKNKEISANTRFTKPRIRLSEIYKEISINKKFSRL